jgi:hypothetical protein
MKKGLLYIILSFSVALIFTACKNDLDVLAPGQESVSVYGILNPNAAVQNIRINKVYLSEGDAITAGQDNSTINYGPGELQVTLQRFMTGSTTPTLTTVGDPSKKKIVLTETVVTTSSGSFGQEQRIWQTSDKLFSKGEYKLTITNVSTGKIFTAQTTMCDSVKSYNAAMPFKYYPNAIASMAFPTHCNGYILDSPPGTGTKQIAYVDYSNTSLPIKFKSVANARLYDVVMRFHYIDTTFTGLGIRQYVDFNFSSQKSSSLVGEEEMLVKFEAIDFYKNLATEIGKKSSVGIKNRTVHYIEYIITAGNETLNTFLQVNAPSNSIAQDKPYYTNISGGVGVFASKSSSAISKELWSAFIDEIADHPSTQPFMFQKTYTFICP